MSDNMILKVIRFLSHEADIADYKAVQSWREQNPKEFDKLKSIIENTPFEKKTFNSEVRKAQLLAKIRMQARTSTKVRTFNVNYWLKIAAIFVGLLSLGIAAHFYNQSLYFEQMNGTANVMEVNLPDGSTVTLDKQSAISYKKDYLNRFTREVNLTGRAYFQIERDTLQKFIVNTTQTQVLVLGTKFTVSDYYAKTQVILNEGKVRVCEKKSEKSFILKSPGEQLIISDNGRVKQGLVNKNLYFSWLEDRLNFNSCKVSETIEFLSDSYDLNIVIENEDALNTQLYGTAPSDSPLLIVEAIARITNHTIVKNGDTITLE